MSELYKVSYCWLFLNEARLNIKGKCSTDTSKHS